MTERWRRVRARVFRFAPKFVLGLALAGAAALAAAQAQTQKQAQPQTLTIGVLSRADDERLAPRRVERAYLGHPGGPVQDGVALAIADSAFELQAAGLEARLDVASAATLEAAQAQLTRLQRAGAVAIVADLPAAWLAPLAAAASVPVFNAGDASDALRQQDCKPLLFHTLPSERMRADAMAQALMARRWSRVLLLHGETAADAPRLATVQAALKRYALKVVATRAFKLSADPRERDRANPLLLTGPSVASDYDAVWVVDSDGEFARALPYRTALPRPVVGDGGLAALGWAPGFERYGSPQLARRFAKAAQRPMTATDWAAWIAGRAVLQFALAQPPAPPAPPAARAETLRKALIAGLAREETMFDGFKGQRLSFRPWDRQLRQPLLLSDGLGVIGLAPADGVLHPRNALDTLGADAPEALCKP
jgi:ABC transporter substrate binding protein (PQQ-dependent alcohol dehydrogenase system)